MWSWYQLQIWEVQCILSLGWNYRLRIWRYDGTILDAEKAHKPAWLSKCKITCPILLLGVSHLADGQRWGKSCDQERVPHVEHAQIPHFKIKDNRWNQRYGSTCRKMSLWIKGERGINITITTSKESQKERTTARLRGVAQKTDHGECCAPGHAKNLHQIPSFENQTKNKFSCLLEAPNYLRADFALDT